MNTGDTIAAISSAVGPAARMVIRLSGPRAIDIAQPICPDASFEPARAMRSELTFANLRCPAWLYSFRAPHSYTADNLIEFHIPGSPALAKLLLDDLLRRGARLAEAGEFTARAYFAGKLDLTEAEGVAATIAASNEQELQAARQLLAGELARRLRPAMEMIAQTLALVEVGIDFAEEDVTFLAAHEIRRRVEEIDLMLARLLEESTRFERLVHEPRVVFVGRPNAGKSTLINALIGRTRSIISDIAGTTRDVLSAELDLPHGRVLLLDVAGIDRDYNPEDSIAMQMHDHAMLAVESAEHVVLVRDVTDSRSPPALPRQPDLFVLSKKDLAPTVSAQSSLAISARTGDGLAQLRNALDSLAFAHSAGGERTGLVLNSRHVACIEETRAALTRVNERVSDGSAELIALELREALDAVGRVLGNVTPDDVLGRIFSSFCIGK
jgi:tRNA modification GTPase